MMPQPSRIDRRRQRTRAQLLDSLIALLQEKPYDQITIQDITDQADINRATFYLHYKDKDDLLLNSMNDIYADLVQRMEPCFESPDGGAANGNTIEQLTFEHVQEYAAFYRVMFSEQGVASFYFHVQRIMMGIVENWLVRFVPPSRPAPVPIPAAAAYYTGATLGLIFWWLSDGRDQSVESITRISTILDTQGAAWLVGEEFVGRHDEKLQ
ncbi:MAG: TetR/AcrR family transcriptional regulator [Blastochloris sp.]|nr:TetR/AcrR family transcriptional regulator [Blastochloris sp.]